MKRVLFFLLFIVHPASSAGLSFHRGVNFSKWMENTRAVDIHFSTYTKQDFRNVRALGCDVIRLPIKLHSLTSGAPDYRIDPLLFRYLDEAVDWAEELGLHIILDNHSHDTNVSTTPQVVNILLPVWKQMALHFRSRSSLVLYEILNEPHGIADASWNSIQRMVVDTIRSIDSIHTIVIGPAGSNSFKNLEFMPVYPDTNLLYTFHFYEPFVFTHQGATWTNPSLVPLAGVPFPYDAARVPVCPSSLSGTWVLGNLLGYENTGTGASIRQLLKKAVDFRAARNVPIFCGEFGAYQPNSSNEDRVRWYDTVRTVMEENGIAWTSWDYQGGFGLFRAGTSGLFNHDLNVVLLSALGLIVPPQTPYVLRPDSVPVPLYTDYPGPALRLSAGTDGTFVPFDTTAPSSGSYCIRWSDALQYQSLVFNFSPDKDLSRLKQQEYALCFSMKSSFPFLTFDVRFVDTKTGPLDHPWRIRWVATPANVVRDGTWHPVRIRLSDMTEHGASDNGWFNPIGAFDWSAIDKLEFALESGNLWRQDLWLDDLRIEPYAPAAVQATPKLPQRFRLLPNFPNPFNPSTTVMYDLPNDSKVSVIVYDVLGRTVAELQNGPVRAGTHALRFDGSSLPSGLYLCTVRTERSSVTQKLLLLK